MTIPKGAKFLNLELEIGKYEVEHRYFGNLVIDGFTCNGVPIPGTPKELGSFATHLFVVEPEYLTHGQGD